MNIYAKLANARADLKSANLKMSGENKFAGYKYFDLADFLPTITQLEKKYNMLSVVRWGADTATLTIYDCETDRGDISCIQFESPMSTAELKGCHAVQNLGAVETYVRRYLYLAAYEIVEAEALDLTQGKPDSKEDKPAEKAEKPNTYLPVENAEEFVITFGKNSGKKLKELATNSLEWYAENAREEILRDACFTVINQRNAPKDELTNLADQSSDDDGGLPF